MELPSLTVAPEDVDVQLLKEVHDEGVDLRQQPHEEDDGEAESEDCGGTHTSTETDGARDSSYPGNTNTCQRRGGGQTHQ